MTVDGAVHFSSRNPARRGFTDQEAALRIEERTVGAARGPAKDLDFSIGTAFRNAVAANEIEQAARIPGWAFAGIDLIGLEFRAARGHARLAEDRHEEQSERHAESHVDHDDTQAVVNARSR